MPPQNKLVLAIVLLVVGNFVAAFSDAAIKVLDADVPAFQFMLLRQVIGVLLLLPLMLVLTPSHRCTLAMPLHFWRGLSMALGGGCMVYALVNLPLATAASLFYTAPLMVLPLAAIWLGERLTGLRVGAALLGIVGVLVLLRPTQINWAALAGLGCALSIAFGLVTLKRLPAQETVVTALFWTTVWSIVPLLLLASLEWQPVSLQLLWVALLSNLLIMAYNGLALLAFRLADASAISPVEYSGLLFAALIGVLGFGEVPDLYSLLGMLIIMAPLWLLGLDGKRARRLALSQESA
ncbi:DMT family transporter [Aestuariirhabdus litorea]|uniref:DMT family transporter n=1 Tax=Aestuariirhabdus litorea TaxID=2528527 RepID=A0A3P3VJ19_9GAMM|nr:DMT family transporter [Aestuariirhabdus litorea]RRJ82741.1 DMT family transporter [Aestuariirhabdus litorea]RWW92901.1 DMT family transporter [Endozoicomonadaceae bacterium GTF-13]